MFTRYKGLGLVTTGDGTYRIVSGGENNIDIYHYIVTRELLTFDQIDVILDVFGD